MKKNDTFILDNGLRIVMCLDTTKKFGYAELITKFGSRTEGYIKDGNEHIITPGVAHMLEHVIIDDSPYGNAFDYLKKKYLQFNGMTSPNTTSFYIGDILDMPTSLRELINIVNNPKFTKESIKVSVKPIIEEIRKSNDNRFKNINDALKDALYVNLHKKESLGTEEDVLSITYEELRECHDIFYNPKNQVLALSGNFDIEEIKKLILEEYAKLKRHDISYELIKVVEPVQVNKPRLEIKDAENEEITMIDFKMSLDNFTNYEKVKLSFYMAYFFHHNFKDGSKIYNYMVDNKYSVYSIESSYHLEEDLAYISFSCFTNHVDEFSKEVLKIVKDLPYDEEEFDIWKKETIIQLILRSEHPNKELGPFVDNVLTYDYDKVDTIEDVNSCNIDEYKEFMGRLDFSNYAIVNRRMP